MFCILDCQDFRWMLDGKKKNAEDSLREKMGFDFKRIHPLHFSALLSNLLWSASHSVVSDSLRPHGLYSVWNSPGQNTGVDSLSLLQGLQAWVWGQLSRSSQHFQPELPVPAWQRIPFWSQARVGHPPPPPQEPWAASIARFTYITSHVCGLWFISNSGLSIFKHH